MKKVFVFYLLMVYSIFLHAQNDTIDYYVQKKTELNRVNSKSDSVFNYLMTKNFILLFNDNYVVGNNVVFKTPLFKKKYFLVDGVEYQEIEVKFFKNEDGFYAKYVDQYWDKSVFVPCQTTGKLNLFSEFRGGGMYYAPGAGGGMVAHGGGGRAIHYFNSGFGDLKLLKYKNLLPSVQNDSLTMEYMVKYQKYNKVQTTATIVSISLFSLGVASMFAGNDTFGPPVAVAGAGALIVTALLNVASPRLTKAIYIYNRNKK